MDNISAEIALIIVLLRSYFEMRWPNSPSILRQSDTFGHLNTIVQESLAIHQSAPVYYNLSSSIYS